MVNIHITEEKCSTFFRAFLGEHKKALVRAKNSSKKKNTAFWEALLHAETPEDELFLILEYAPNSNVRDRCLESILKYRPHAPEGVKETARDVLRQNEVHLA